jgi:two-component system, OmpR family, response regulator ResD
MKKSRRVLIVDDDWRSVDILSRLLRDCYILKTASTGDACLVELAEFRPHLVLLDIMMPGISGHETCRRIKFSPMSDSVRIILVSAKETIVDHVRGSDVLADDAIVKPFDHDELLAKVQAQFDQMDRGKDSESTLGDEPEGSDSSMSQQQRERLAAALRRLEENHLQPTT